MPRGALKLKEISYTATDAYAAGEMKHGPIALLDEGTPVVVVATDSPVLEKVVSNMQEVRARGASVIAVGGDSADPHADAVLRVPEADWMLQPLLAVTRCSCWPTGSRGYAGSTSTSRATWPRPSPSKGRGGRRRPLAGVTGESAVGSEISRVEQSLIGIFFKKSGCGERRGGKVE